MNTQNYKEILEAEIVQIKEGLSTIAHETHLIKDDWVPNPTSQPENDVDMLADQAEELEINAGVIDTLEERLQEVNTALERIDSGTYGKCATCGNEIEALRLGANPAATTCIACTA